MQINTSTSHLKLLLAAGLAGLQCLSGLLLVAERVVLAVGTEGLWEESECQKLRREREREARQARTYVVEPPERSRVAVLESLVMVVVVAV